MSQDRTVTLYYNNSIVRSLLQGRTGTLICCYLLYKRYFTNPDEVIAFFVSKRMKRIDLMVNLLYASYCCTSISVNQVPDVVKGSWSETVRWAVSGER